MRDQLREENRQLRLSEASSRSPAASTAWLANSVSSEPQPGQVVHATTHIDSSAPVLAQVNAPQPNPAN